MNKSHLLCTLFLLGLATTSQAQLCDPTFPPTGLTQTVMPGNGVLLQWTPVPGSTGVQIKAMLPSGLPISSARISGYEIGSYHLNEPFLETGTYFWRVQASCGTAPSTMMTPPSSPSSFGFSPGFCPDSVSDADGNYYTTLLIGTQCWFKENLRTEHYRNGDPIPSGLSNTDWSAANYGAFASPNPTHKANYGLLYNWYAVTDDRRLCPYGFKVANQEEWHALVAALGGEDVAGGAMKATGTVDLGTGLWKNPNFGATNSSGFTALPAGMRHEMGGYTEATFKAYFWGGREDPGATGMRWKLSKYDARVATKSESKKRGLSVRCVAY